MANHIDMQGPNVFVKHDEGQQPRGYADALHELGSTVLERGVIQPASRLFAIAGAVLHFTPRD